MPYSRPILLVEDNPADVRLLIEAFRELRQPHEVHTVMDGAEALDFLYRRGPHADKPRPELILLDINLPKLTGHQVLRTVKSDENLKSIPVLMLTNSDYTRDIQAAYDEQAEGYLRKPTDLSDYFAVVEQIEKYWTELPSAVTSSIFWVNTPAQPRDDSDVRRRVMGIPTPLNDPPKCRLREIERSTTASLCKLIEYAGDDGNSYYHFIGNEGATWVVNRRA